jgi:hypothetical protein
MYNELFKMLDERVEESAGQWGGEWGAELSAQREGNPLHLYWLEIADLQKAILGPYIERSGLRGMYEYWGRIMEEENCRGEMELTDDYFEFRMQRCPSLSKNLDNDSGPFELYCDHCAGWIGPVAASYGYHLVYDIVSRKEPRCVFRIYKDKEKADAFENTASLAANWRTEEYEKRSGDD